MRVLKKSNFNQSMNKKKIQIKPKRDKTTDIITMDFINKMRLIAKKKKF